MQNKPLKVLISLIALVLATELAVIYVGPVITKNPIFSIIGRQVKTTNSKGNDFDILILGDSSANIALNASVISHVTKLKCYNFSTTGNLAMAGNYFLLRDYLKSHSPPKYIILMNVYDMWGRSLNVDGVSTLLGTYFFKDIVRALFNRESFDVRRGEFLRRMSHYILPSQRYKYEFRRALEHPKTLLESFEDRMDLKLKDIMAQDSGNYLRYLKLIEGVDLKEGDLGGDEIQRKSDLSQDAIAHLSYLSRNSFHVSRFNLFYLKQICDLAKENDIKVFFCFPPILEAFTKMTGVKKHFDGYRNFMHYQARSFDNVDLLMDDFYAVPIGKLGDTIDHLNEEESASFSLMLARRILAYERILDKK